MKKTILCLVALILMLFSASALAAGSDEALVTACAALGDIGSASLFSSVMII